ncbi:MAG: N-acetyltransferase [Pseudomonadota bacterium]
MSGAPTVRLAATEDDAAVDVLLRDAFEGPGEAALARALRADDDVAVEIVVTSDGVVVAYACFSRLVASAPAYALAPVATAASFRRRGFAEMAVREGLSQLAARGPAAVIVLGDPAYYVRFGFSHALTAACAAPYSGPAFMALTVSGAPAPKGPISYAPAFDRLT